MDHFKPLKTAAEVSAILKTLQFSPPGIPERCERVINALQEVSGNKYENPEIMSLIQNLANLRWIEMG